MVSREEYDALKAQMDALFAEKEEARAAIAALELSLAGARSDADAYRAKYENAVAAMRTAQAALTSALSTI